MPRTHPESTGREEPPNEEKIKDLIRAFVSEDDIGQAQDAAFSLPEDQRADGYRLIYDELMKREKFFDAARLALRKIQVGRSREINIRNKKERDETSTLTLLIHDFTLEDVRRAGLLAYAHAKRHPGPPIAGDSEQNIRPDSKPEWSDAELIKRYFKFTDKDVDGL